MWTHHQYLIIYLSYSFIPAVWVHMVQEITSCGVFVLIWLFYWTASGLLVKIEIISTLCLLKWELHKGAYESALSSWLTRWLVNGILVYLLFWWLWRTWHGLAKYKLVGLNMMFCIRRFHISSPTADGHITPLEFICLHILVLLVALVWRLSRYLTCSNSLSGREYYFQFYAIYCGRISCTAVETHAAIHTRYRIHILVLLVASVCQKSLYWTYDITLNR